MSYILSSFMAVWTPKHDVTSTAILQNPVLCGTV